MSEWASWVGFYYSVGQWICLKHHVTSRQLFIAMHQCGSWSSPTKFLLLENIKLNLAQYSWMKNLCSTAWFAYSLCLFILGLADADHDGWDGWFTLSKPITDLNCQVTLHFFSGLVLVSLVSPVSHLDSWELKDRSFVGQCYCGATDITIIWYIIWLFTSPFWSWFWFSWFHLFLVWTDEKARQGVSCIVWCRELKHLISLENNI